MRDPILDKNSTDLLNDLRNDFEIEFQEKNINFCGVHTKNGKSIIDYNPTTYKVEHINHELLHIWLNRYKYTIGNHIYLIFESDWKLGKIFTKHLCDYIENCFDHNKMYPKYLEMGYEPEKFIRDGHKEQCSINDIKKLHLKFLGKYKADSINKFIGYLISIYADHIDRDYSEHLELLEKKEPELFKIVTDFWNSWLAFDITNIDPVFNSDMELVENFMTDIEQWIETKKIK